MAGKAQSPNDRTVLLEMALHWSRLAEYAIKQRSALVPETQTGARNKAAISESEA
jgi:hypothetical protein